MTLRRATCPATRRQGKTGEARCDLEPLEMARLVTDEVYLVTDDPPRKSLVYALAARLQDVAPIA